MRALLARLDPMIDRSGGPEACWPYTGGSLVQGYPVIYTTMSAKTRRLVKVHRLLFEVETGLCPPAVDHMCHDSAECKLDSACPHRRCCNPRHFEASTLAANAHRARKGVHRHETMCGKGLHRRTPENTYEAPSGQQRCRPCDAARARDARAEAKAQRPAHERKRSYRPRGMSKGQLVDWALAGQSQGVCCYWPDVQPDGGGYAQVRFAGKMFGAHTLVFEVKHGPVPPGHVVDHTCHDPATCEGGLLCPHRPCINPEHLAAVTRGGNSAAHRSWRYRPEACQEGHEFTPDNTYVDERGSRHCLACQLDGQRRRRAAEKAAPGWRDGRERVGGLCRNEHVVADVGVNKYGKCKACVRATSQRHKAKQRVS
jgi:hypothetical protein